MDVNLSRDRAGPYFLETMPTPTTVREIPNTSERRGHGTRSGGNHAHARNGPGTLLYVGEAWASHARRGAMRVRAMPTPSVAGWNVPTVVGVGMLAPSSLAGHCSARAQRPHRIRKLRIFSIGL